MYNEILGCMTIAGTFLQPASQGSMGLQTRTSKKARQAKQDAIMQQYEEDLQEKFNEGYQAFQADLALCTEALTLRQRLEHGRCFITKN